MSLLLVICGLAALTLPGMRAANILRGHPHWFAPLDALALVLGIVAVIFGLGLSIGVGAVHVVGGSSLWRYQGHLAPGGILASAASTLLLGYILSRLVTVIRHGRRARQLARPDSWLGYHERHPGHELVVIPTDSFLAYAIDGSPPQIVISEGLCDRLDDDMIGFVIAHERAHLRLRHRRYLLVAAVVDALCGAISLIARSTLALRLAVERAADEDAAGSDRRRRDQVCAGLARLTSADDIEPAFTRDALVYRTRLLAAPAPRLAQLELLASGGLVALSLLTVSIAAHATGDMPALLGLLRN